MLEARDIVPAGSAVSIIVVLKDVLGVGMEEDGGIKQAFPSSPLSPNI